MDAYLSEPRDLFHGDALCVVRPEDAGEVARVLALCNELGVGIVPQGGNTGLVGGQTPDMSGRQIVLSLQRLDRVREVDLSSDAMTLEAA
jgi:4-phosphoerythronate dehydrogenase (FAD-dependent)